DFGIGVEPFGDDDLLLVAAAQIEHALLEIRRLDAKRCDELLRALLLAAHIEDASAREPPERAQHHVLPYGQGGENTVTLAVSGHERNAVLDGVAGCAHSDGLATEKDAAAVDRIGSEDRPRGLRSLRADEPRNAYDLATSYVETDTVKFALARERFDAEHLLARFGFDLRELVLQVAADHQADHFVNRRRRHGHGGDERAVAEDRRAGAHGLTFVQPVRHVDDSHTPLFEAGDGGGRRWRARL